MIRKLGGARLAATRQRGIRWHGHIRQVNANHFRCVAVKDLTQVSFCNRTGGKERMKEAQTKAIAYLETVQGTYLVTSEELKRGLEH